MILCTKLNSTHCRRAGYNVKTNPGDASEQAGDTAGTVQPEIRTCPACGTKLPASGPSWLCPVCVLRRAVSEESAAVGSPGSASEVPGSFGETRGGSQARRFENYELILDHEGRAIELGRDAMGVTYKALDVDLRRQVTLKVINERYLGNESAQLCFLREARSAASVRHPNVASVLHFGQNRKQLFLCDGVRRGRNP